MNQLRNQRIDAMLKPGRYEITIKAEDWPSEVVEDLFAGLRPRAIIAVEITGCYRIDGDCSYLCNISQAVTIEGLLFAKNMQLVSDSLGFAVMAFNEDGFYPQMERPILIPCKVDPLVSGEALWT